MPDPTAAHRRFAAAARAIFTALVDEGFTDDQAVTLLARLLSPASPGPDSTSLDTRRSLVESLLSGQKPPATRSPVVNRAADLWNPPTEGAPAHDR